ncbi:MAG: hypothetical protein LKJ76_08990 [Lachnospiraceae bacterium]|nr:hypothetical protein [Lachnospiraceae bacterium]
MVKGINRIMTGVLLMSVLSLMGCGSASGTAATSAAATSAAATSAAATSAAAVSAAATSAAASASTDAAGSSGPKVTTSQTAPVTLTADGVIEEPMMSTIEIKMNGADQSFLKADEDFDVEGDLQRGKQVEVSYQLDTQGSYVAMKVVVNDAPRQADGKISDETMNTVTMTVSSGSMAGKDVTFSKDENCVHDDDILVGSAASIYYEGELDGDMPIAYAILDSMADSGSASAATSAAASATGVKEMTGVVTDLGMSTIQLRSDTDVSLLKDDNFTCSGNMVRGSFVTVEVQEKNGDMYAMSATVDGSTKSVTGTYESEAMSTVQVKVNADGGTKEVSFLKDDNFFEDDGIKEGSGVTVTFTGSYDDGPTAYAVLSGTD